MKTTTKPSLYKVKSRATTNETELNKSEEEQAELEQDNEPGEKKEAHEVRELLKSRSRDVEVMVTDGQFDTVNAAIIHTIYKDDVHKEFKTYNEWKKEGFQVKKGAKAFPLWGRPKEIETKLTDGMDQSKDAPDEPHEFFPVASVFSNAQVTPIKREKEQEKVNEIGKLRSKGRERNS